METKILDTYDSSLFEAVVNSTPAFPLSFIADTTPEAIRQHNLSLIKQGFKNGIVFTSFHNGKIVATASLIRLDWDSVHFGFECYTINNCYFDQAIDEKEVSEVFKNLIEALVSFAKSKKARFIYTSINSWSTGITNGLQENKFKYILTWLDGVVRSADISQYLYTEKAGHTIGLINESEVSVYSEMAAENYFKGGRFFLDSNFDQQSIQDMYAKLVRSSFEKNDIMISYRINNDPVGLFVCKKITEPEFFADNKIAPLRFLVVSPEVRKMGISKDLFTYTLKYLGEKSNYITTGLEIHNLTSLNLHSKMNFKFHYTHNVFHWWDTAGN